MSDTITILYAPTANFFKFALVKPNGDVCEWSSSLTELSTRKGDSWMQSDGYWQSRTYCKLRIPATVTTEQQILALYPELLI